LRISFWSVTNQQSMMELNAEVQELIASFTSISSQCNIVLHENEKLKKKINTLERLAAEVKEDNESLKKELYKKQEIVELMHQQLSVIPALKEVSDKNFREYGIVKDKLLSKEKEIDRLEQKHLEDIKSLKIDIEDDKKKRTFLESKRVQELEDFYKQAQSTEFSSLVKKMESEKKLLLDQLEDKNEVIKSLNADHRKEIEKLKVQLYAAKMTDVEASSNSLSAEFYRKKILSLQEHYEKQINELAGTCNSIGIQPPSPTPKTPRKLISLIPKSPLSKSSPSCSPKVKSLHTVESPKLKMPNTPTSVKPLHTIESPKFKMPKTPTSVHNSSKLSSKPNESPAGSIMKSQKKKVTFQVPESPKRLMDKENVGNSEFSSKSNAHNGSFLREDFWSNLSEESFKQPSAKITPDPDSRKQLNYVKRFKLSSCSSTKYGEVSEFGHFQVKNTSSYEDKRNSTKKKDLDTTGMKRKLFDEPHGPQSF